MADDAYTCQRCRQPLLLDPSLANVTQAQYDLIAGSLPSPSPPSNLSAEEKLSRVPTSAASRQAYRDAIAAAGAASSTAISHGNANESFILLSDSQLGLPGGRARTSSPASQNSQGQRPITPQAKPSGEGPAPAATNPPSTSSQSLSTRLLNLVSSHTPVDHPLCIECAQVLQDALQDKLEEVQRERDAYIGFERRWAAAVAEAEGKRSLVAGESADKEAASKARLRPSAQSQDHDAYVGLSMPDREFEKLQAANVELKEEEARLIKRLTEVESQQQRLDQEEQELAREEDELQKEETDFLHQFDAVQAQIRNLEAELRTERTLHLIATQTLARLEATNVYNDVFQIGHVPLVTSARGVDGPNLGDGRRRTGAAGTPGGGAGTGSALSGTAAGGMITPGTTQTVGTINGLRLGGRPWVDWPEINAAFGLVALCIDRIAAKVGCTFETYKIVPLGSFSRIDELPPSKNSYELYASSDITPARLLQNRRFNYALVGLLDCLRQLIAFGKAHRRGWEGGGLEIHKDKIGEYSIRLSFGMGMSSIGLGTGGTGSKEEESWTRALRAVLAVLKRVLVIESEADREAVEG